MGRMSRMRVGSLAVTLVALLASAVTPASVMSAQALNRTLDEGTFLIPRAAAPVGRESSRITRSQSPTGDAYRATAHVAPGDRRTRPTLTRDSTRAPCACDVAVQGATGG